jgi:hypothetical protein
MAKTVELNALPTAETAQKTDSVLLEVDGSIRRMTLTNLMPVLTDNYLLIKALADDDTLLAKFAWGVPIMESQTSQEWGVIGNTGMWEEYKSTLGRYLVKNDGTAAKLSKTDGTVYADGTALDESKGHVMVIGKALYSLVREDAATGQKYAWFSQLPISEHRWATCNNGEYICLGAYMGSVVNSALVSRSGYGVQRDCQISTFWNYAQKNGSDWGLMGYEHWQWVNALSLSEYGNPNIQTTLGYGPGGTSGAWNAVSGLKTGATATYGDSSCAVDIENAGTSSCHTSLFGLENLYNWYWTMTQGVYFGSSSNDDQDGTEVFIYSGNRMPTSAELTTHPTGEYRKLTRSTGWSGNTIHEMLLGEYFDLMPKSASGSDNSRWWGDAAWLNSTGQLLLWGAAATYGSQAGLVASNSNNAFSHSSAVCAARLAFYGNLTFVSGAKM